jgi:hypothetical protein
MTAEAEKIEIEIVLDNAETAAGQLELTAKQLERMQKTQEMIARTQGDIQRRNLIDQYKKEASAVTETANAWKKKVDAMQVVPANLQKTNTALIELRGKLGPAAALIGTLGSAFSQLSPQASGAFGAMQKFTAAMSQAMAFAGAGGSVGGPAGAVVGGIVGLISGIGAAMGMAKQEADALAKATEANAKAMGSYLDQIDKLRGMASQKRGQYGADAALRNRMDKGLATSTEYSDEIDVLQGRIGDQYYSDKTLKGLLAQGTSTGRDEWDKRQRARTKLEQMRDKYTRFQSQAEEQERIAKQNEWDKKHTEEDVDVGLGAEKKPRARGGNVRDQIDALDALGRQMADTQLKRDQDNALAHRDAELKWTRQTEEQKYDLKHKLDEIDRNRSTKAEEDDAAEKEAIWQRSLEKRAELAHANQDMLHDIATQGSNIMASTAIKSFQMMAKGQKVAVGQILEGIGDQIVAMGQGYIFKGIAESILLNPQGPALIGVGSAAVAFGIGLGAAGAHAPGGSTASGGGAAAAASNPLGPRSYQTPSPLGEVTGPTVININFPTVLSPSAVDGARIQSAVRQAQRVYG